MRRDLSLIGLILLGKLADIWTSWRPAQGLVPGLQEGNPLVVSMITRHGVPLTFASLTLVSLAAVSAFWAMTWVEEVRAAHRLDLKLIRRIKTTRTIGLAALAFLAILPPVVNIYGWLRLG